MIPAQKSHGKLDEDLVQRRRALQIHQLILTLQEEGSKQTSLTSPHWSKNKQ
jgi:hypothetical protein